MIQGDPGSAQLFACADDDSSPTSSSNSVPPCAAASLPSMRRTAVECAPCTAPNSSLSIKDSGIAAQLSSTKGCSARGLFS